MSEITVVARMRAKKGCEAMLETAMREVVVPTHGEAGCLKYILHRAAEDPSQMAVLERWTSKQALDLHLKTPHIQKLFKLLPPLLETEPEIQVFTALPEGSSSKNQF